MDRAALQRVLAMAVKHVAECESHVARQIELIAEMEDLGLDTKHSKALLSTFQETLILYIADQDRALRELDA
jgi:hypothetical protein